MAVPADLLVLRTSQDDGFAYVETKQLDGETNLKQKEEPKLTENMKQNNFYGIIRSQTNTEDLESWDGTLEIAGESKSMSLANMFLRGCNMRNTDKILCVVLYIGNDTKI